MKNPFYLTALGTLVILVMVAACGAEEKATLTPTILQELRANLGAEPSTLDPQLATGLHEFSVIRQVFDGLLDFNQDLSLKPAVALEVPTPQNGGISQDGLTYTFRLRTDATWSDGQTVTAEDFVFATKRLFDPALGAPSSFIFFDIKGALEYATAVDADPAAMQVLRDGVSVEAVDQHTLRITLAQPSPTFLQKAALIPLYPVRRDIVEGTGAQWTAAGTYIGNGPYRMIEWVHQDHITLEANPNYWGPKPKLNKIIYRMIPDPNAELAAYRNAELDISQVPPGVEAATLADPRLSSEVVRSPQLFTFGVFFNTAIAPFNDPSVRRAFAMAMDRDSWVEKVKNGVGVAATGWLPPGMPGYEPGLGSDHAFNRDGARQLLAQAGFPNANGFPRTSYLFVDVGEQRLIAEFLQAQFQDNLGVQVSLEAMDPPSYFQRVIGARDFQITGIGWGADYPDPESFLGSLFVSQSPQNIVGYSSAEFDGVAGQAFSELDQTARIDLWRNAHRILVRDLPVAPLFHGERFFLQKPKVQGLTLTPIDGAIPGDTMLDQVFIGP